MQRILALTLGLGLAVLIAVVGARLLRPEPKTLTLIEVDQVVLDTASAEAAGRVAEGGFRTPLDEETVREIMPVRGMRLYDPYCYFRYKPHRDQHQRWSEHPDGGFRVYTNSIGLRQDEEVATVKPDLRVLVAGDSHTTGVCSNAETFAAQLEDRLAAAVPTRSVEVLNGSHGAYSFFHYLGVLERMLALDMRPDLFVVVVYGGNDFRAVNLWHFFQGTKAPPLDRTEMDLRREAADRFTSAMGQVLSAAHHFAIRDGEVEIALRMSDRLMAETQRLCAAEGIGLLVVYLPAPTEVPEQAVLTKVEKCREFMGLEPEDLARLGVMADRLLDQLEAHQVPAIDLRSSFREHEGLLYWKADLHLNLDGHIAAADVVAPWVEEWWPSRNQ
jgi:lysophospholipase L1-like esterase